MLHIYISDLWNICNEIIATYLQQIGNWPLFHICHRYVTDMELSQMMQFCQK